MKPKKCSIAEISVSKDINEAKKMLKSRKKCFKGANEAKKMLKSINKSVNSDQ
ncbi:hypothetical protein [Bacillus sp. UMB0893]|uniref:hypothetical protein n=1 Tax=Bacillus sp. UMB0893 TaxID=2066053 RepID=UPI001C6100EB|nr:hypothetical protein [Bacillus sp. UMB0893]